MILMAQHIAVYRDMPGSNAEAEFHIGLGSGLQTPKPEAKSASLGEHTVALLAGAGYSRKLILAMQEARIAKTH